MPLDGLRITPLSPHIGAEIQEIDLVRPLSNGQVAALRDALDTHQVLFFRDQDLDYDAAKRVGRYFGELAIHPNTAGPAGHPEILPVHADADSKRIAGERWHSDVSCDPVPPYTSLLHLKIVPDLGGDTLFASQYAAYDALSPRFKTYLEGLEAYHDGAPSYRATNVKIGKAETGHVYPNAVHPVVRTNPRTGRKGLFVNRGFTQRILGLPDDESLGVLAFLFEHSTKPDFQVRFKWRAGSLAIWDNRFVQHLAIWDYFPKTRSGFRVTVKGEKPV